MDVEIIRTLKGEVHVGGSASEVPNLPVVGTGD